MKNGVINSQLSKEKRSKKKTVKTQGGSEEGWQERKGIEIGRLGRKGRTVGRKEERCRKRKVIKDSKTT